MLGGSGAATPELVACLAESTLTDEGRLDVVLVGRSTEKLARVAGAANALSRGRIRVSTATNVVAGVTGADFVVNQVRVGGLAARAYDESFPHGLGIPGEETVGPGGFANALRTLPVVGRLASVIEREAPAAWVINLTNPAGIVQQLLERTTRLKAVSVCDSPVTLVEQALAAVGGGTPEYVGLNHAGVLCGLYDGVRDLLPAALDAYASSAVSPVAGEIVRTLGVLPNAYMRYYYAPEVMLEAQRQKRSRAEELLSLEQEMLDAYKRPVGRRPEPLKRRGAAWYAKGVVPVIEALAGVRSIEMVVCSRNGASLPWLPPDAAVEMPTTIDEGGLAGRRAAYPGPDTAGLLAALAAYEQLTLEGVLEQNEAKLVRALMSNPLVPSYATAAEVLRLARAGAQP